MGLSQVSRNGCSVHALLWAAGWWVWQQKGPSMPTGGTRAVFVALGVLQVLLEMPAQHPPCSMCM